MTIAHNTIRNTLGASIVLGDALEGVIEDNFMSNAGQGILISAFGPYGGPAVYGPVINNDVLRNTLAVGAGNLSHSTTARISGESASRIFLDAFCPVSWCATIRCRPSR